LRGEAGSLSPPDREQARCQRAVNRSIDEARGLCPLAELDDASKPHLGEDGVDFGIVAILVGLEIAVWEIAFSVTADGTDDRLVAIDGTGRASFPVTLKRVFAAVRALDDFDVVIKFDATRFDAAAIYSSHVDLLPCL
jgi:hypothetical protein